MQPEIKVAHELEDAQQKIFGTKKNNATLLEEQNYTSRPNQIQVKLPDQNVFQPRDLGGPKKSIVAPIVFENLKVYHFACLNVGQSDILSIDIKADSQWVIKVQKQIYKAYAKLSQDVSNILDKYTSGIYK